MNSKSFFWGAPVENDRHEAISRRLKNLENTVNTEYSNRMRELEVELKEHIATCTERDKRMVEHEESIKGFCEDCEDTQKELKKGLALWQTQQSKWKGVWVASSVIAIVIGQLINIGIAFASLWR